MPRRITKTSIGCTSSYSEAKAAKNHKFRSWANIKNDDGLEFSSPRILIRSKCYQHVIYRNYQSIRWREGEKRVMATIALTFNHIIRRRGEGKLKHVVCFLYRWDSQDDSLLLPFTLRFESSSRSDDKCACSWIFRRSQTRIALDSVLVSSCGFGCLTAIYWHLALWSTCDAFAYDLSSHERSKRRTSPDFLFWRVWCNF